MSAQPFDWLALRVRLSKKRVSYREMSGAALPHDKHKHIARGVATARRDCSYTNGKLLEAWLQRQPWWHEMDGVARFLEGESMADLQATGWPDIEALVRQWL